MNIEYFLSLTKKDIDLLKMGIVKCYNKQQNKFKDVTINNTFLEFMPDGSINLKLIEKKDIVLLACFKY